MECNDVVTERLSDEYQVARRELLTEMLVSLTLAVSVVAGVIPVAYGLLFAGESLFTLKVLTLIAVGCVIIIAGMLMLVLQVKILLQPRFHAARKLRTRLRAAV